MRTNESPGSLILGSLLPIELDTIAEDLERVRLEPGKTIVAAHEPIRRVYFPDSCLVALSLMLPDGRTAGVTLVGDEGIVGLSAVIAVPAVTDAVVQVGGYARMMAADRFRAAIRASEAFRTLIEAYTVALHAHLAQTVACNRLHGLDQRAARWLLLAHHRTTGDAFPLTQEAFADLLGVSRPAVSTVGARFARSGIAEFRRGTVRILDISRLERASCECHEADREAFGAVVAPSIVPTRTMERLTARSSLTMIRPVIRRAR